MSDLIDGYVEKGLISNNPRRHFRDCDSCDGSYHMDDLHAVDICECNGSHSTVLICDVCKVEMLHDE